MQQRTIEKPVSLSGVGLHSGEEVVLSLLPSEVDSGIRFQRTDLPNNPIISVSADKVKDTVMSSNLIEGDVKIGTVEHLLSAVSAMGIDNLLIQVSDAEMPIMDGSAINFIKLIEQAGINEQTEKKKFLKIVKPVRVEQGDKWAELLPMEEIGFQLNFEIQFDHPAIASTPQVVQFKFSKQNFIEQISEARTFGFLKDIEQLRKNNLALGGSLDNAIVVDDNGVVNEEGLRFADEFVRHKILDAVGDLYLIGSPILGRYNAYKSGHGLNNALIKAVLEDKLNYEFVTINDSVKLYV